MGQWLEKMYQNDSLVNGNQDYSLRNLSSVILSHMDFWGKGVIQPLSHLFFPERFKHVQVAVGASGEVQSAGG